MNLALAILFLWLGSALFFVAFHPIHAEDLNMPDGQHPLGATTIVSSLRGQLASRSTVYNA